MHGILLADLPLCTGLTPGATGGWDIRDFKSEAQGVAPYVYKDTTRPTSLRLGELCVTEKPMTTGVVSDYLRIRGQSSTLPIGSASLAGAGGVQPWQAASFTFGTDTYTSNGSTQPRPEWDTRLFCASAEWSRSGTAQTIYTANTRALSQGYQQDPAATVTDFSFNSFGNLGFQRVATPTALTALSVTASTCRYITRLDLTVCEFRFESALAEPVRECKLATWWADDFELQKPYENNTPPDVTFCQANPTWPGCAFIHPDIDGSSPAICNGQPPFLWSGNWLDFTWVPAAFLHLGTVFQHWSTCLFMPKEGFDKQRWIANNWESSSAGAMQGVFESLGAAVSIPSTCGVIITGVPEYGIPTINTCSWNAWAGPIRLVLYWSIIGLSAIWVMQFVAGLVTGVLNKRMNNPLGGADS